MSNPRLSSSAFTLVESLAAAIILALACVAGAISLAGADAESRLREACAVVARADALARMAAFDAGPTQPASSAMEIAAVGTGRIVDPAGLAAPYFSHAAALSIADQSCVVLTRASHPVPQFFPLPPGVLATIGVSDDPFPVVPPIVTVDRRAHSRDYTVILVPADSSPHARPLPGRIMLVSGITGMIECRSFQPAAPGAEP